MPNLTEQTVAEYFASLRSMDAERCAALFAPNAVQHDPVGTPPNESPEAILGFFTGVFGAFKSLSLTEAAVFLNGSSAAVKWNGEAVAPSGKSIAFEGIDVLDCDASGKIVMVRAFWDPAPVMAILAA